MWHQHRDPVLDLAVVLGAVVHMTVDPDLIGLECKVKAEAARHQLRASPVGS